MVDTELQKARFVCFLQFLFIGGFVLCPQSLLLRVSLMKIFRVASLKKVPFEVK